VKKISQLILVLVSACISFNLIYTFLAIVAEPLIGHSLINSLKYLAYILLLGSAGLALFLRLKTSPITSLKHPPRYVLLVVIMLAWAVISFAYSQASLWQSARGLSVDFSGLILLLTIWLWQPTSEQAKKLVYVIVGTLLAFAIISIPEIITNHAFRVWSGHDLEFHFVVQHIPQLRSLTSGPNPFGTLMVLLSALIVWQVRDLRLRYSLLLFSGFILGLTYARSAWLGVGLMGTGIFFAELKRRKLAIWPVVLALSILIGVTYGAVRYHEGVINILSHGGSTDEHSKTAQDALDEARNRTFQASIFGFGIGTAGPVVYGTPEEKKGNFIKITEDWYLQLIEEVGFVGLIVYLALYYEVIKQLFLKNQRILAWLTIGLALNAMFLHIWSTDINLNLIFWSVVGLALTGYLPQKPSHEPHS
jgi:hypothetical protein